MRRLVLLVILLGGLGRAPALLAQACSSAASGSWTVAATWNAPCNVVGGPTAANAVTINNGHLITTPAAAVAAGSLDIAAGATATSLTLGGNLTVTNAVFPNTGNVRIFGSTANVTRTLSVNSRTVAVTGSVTVNGGTAGGGVTNIGQLTVTTGIVTIGGALNITAGNVVDTNVARVTLTSGRITVTGATTLTGGANGTRDALLTIAGASVAGNGYILNGTLDINAPTATGSSSVTFTGAAGGRITVAGNVTNRDTLTVAGGIFTANGATFATTATTHSATTSVAAGTLTINGAATVNGSATTASTATMSVTGAGRITVTGNTTVTGGNAAGRNATLLVSGIGAVGQGVNVGGNLTIASAGATRATAQMSGVTVGASSSRITVTGNVTNGDQLFADTGVFTANGATFATTATTNAAITRVTTGTLTIAGNATVNASTTVNSTCTMTVSTGRITVTGNLTVTGGNNAALRNALLSVTGAPAVPGDGVNVNGILSTVLTTGTVGSATISITAANGVVNANGNFTNLGTFTNNAVAGQLFLGGAVSTINGSFIRGTGRVTMDGVAPLALTQNLSGTALAAAPAANGFNDFIINNTTGFGVTLGSTVAVKGTTTFTAGNVTTGANTLVTVPSCAAPSVVRTSGHVIGNLQKAIPAGASSCTFEVGSAAGYIPIGTTFVAGTGAGNVTASANGAEHPSIGGSAIDSTKSVNRYWTLANGAAPLLTLPAAGFTAAFNFITPGDYDGGADPAKFTVQRFSGGSWFATAVNATCTPIAGPYLCNQVNGLTVAAGFGDFAIGEANYSAGNAGWFNAFETTTGAGAHLGNVFTKIVGAAFNLDVVAVNALRNGVKPNYSTNPITVELLNSSDNSGALTAETDCRASWTLVPGQSFSLSPVWVASRATITIPAQASALKEGRIRVTQGTLVGCSIDNFTIRPTIFTISSSDATNTDTTGTPAIKAGANFNLAAASVAGYNGTPTVDNTAGMVTGTPTQGTIGGSFSAAPIGTGTATGSTFTYSEVGNFGLNANAVFDSSFTSVDTPGGDCIAGFSNILVGGQYGCSIGSTAVAQTTGISGFGRFIPDNFGVSYNTPAFTPGCGTFSYVGAPFSYGTAPVMTVTARNSSNAPTTNYAGAYMKLTNAKLASTPYATQADRYSRFDAGSTPALDTALLPLTAVDPAIGVFAGGVGTLTFASGTGLGFTRSTTTPNAPFPADIALALNVIDTDDVVFAANPAGFGTASSGGGMTFTGSNNGMRFGRLRMLNASGSEKIDLPIPLEAQHWTGTGFLTNTADGCTSLSAANLSFSAYTGGITAGNMNAANISLGGAFVLGVGNLKLIKPTTPVLTSPGSTTLTINLTAESKTYLQGNWGVATYTANPSARAAFGLYSSQPRNFIFFRENY